MLGVVYAILKLSKEICEQTRALVVKIDRICFPVNGFINRRVVKTFISSLRRALGPAL